MGIIERFWEKVDEFEDGLPFAVLVGELPAWAAFISGFFASIILMAKMLSGVEAGLAGALGACVLLTMAAGGYVLASCVWRIVHGGEPHAAEDGRGEAEDRLGGR